MVMIMMIAVQIVLCHDDGYHTAVINVSGTNSSCSCMTPMSVVFFSLRLLLCITICVVIKHRTQYVNVSVCSCKLQELAEALCQCWETIETSYTDNCKKVFLVMRLERDQIIRYFYDVR